MIHNLSNINSILGNFLSEIRNIEVQNDSMRFRRNLERIAEVIGYELTKRMEFETISVSTPLGKAEVNVLKHQPVLATILRAGLGMHQGLLNYYVYNDNTFLKSVSIKPFTESKILTLDNVAFESLDKNENQNIVNKNGEKYSIIHQINRCNFNFMLNLV